MAEPESDPLVGAIIDEHIEVTFEQVTVFCATRPDAIRALVAEGVIHPRGGSESEWRFAGHTLRRAAKALRLQRDLEVNTAATALILDLLEEIDRLRARIPPDGN